MMFNAQSFAKSTCNLLAVRCGKVFNSKQKFNIELSENCASYPFPELVSSGRLEVQTLDNPTTDEFRRVVDSSAPNIVYLQGEQCLDEEEVGYLVWGGVDLSTTDAISGLFGSTLPTIVYLEIPNGDNLAAALHSKGVPYVIYWKTAFSCYEACHFRQALLSVVQSSCSHTWDSFQLAHASFRLYCARSSHSSPTSNHKISGELGPRLLGDPPQINIAPVEKEENEEDDEDIRGALPSIKVFDDDITMRFLVCGPPCTLDACLLGSLEDGLNALLNIEIRGSKLHNRVSAPPPPLQAGTFSRGVVTMKCDLSTCSSAHISILVSGSAHTCFDDQLLENHIKNELVERSQLVHALPNSEESLPSFSQPRRSASIACGATVFEVCMKVPTWASQVLRQLAPDISYRSFVALGIASIQGLAVASFEKDDTERLLYFFTNQGNDLYQPTNGIIPSCPPSWLKPPYPSRKRPSPKTDNGNNKENKSSCGVRLKVAAMRPIPHTRHQKMLPFSGIPEANGCNGGQVVKASLPVVPSVKHNIVGPSPVTHRKSLSSSFQAQQIISLNPLPLKKHGCGRPPIQVCSEEEFLRDVMQFLILRGHARLVPQGGLAEFPDAILNAKRLDLYNLYREVVSRGGFHVGNGINWKGQVFSKMRNHTVTNRMTGVGNTLKRHYETYLLEYELAHDDVDGECCLLCHRSVISASLSLFFFLMVTDEYIGAIFRSSAAGDWVNCGVCGEWAHFGCDRRQGLGAFKDYAKTDGLEYICPHCSVTNFRRKSQKIYNGYS
ncbi:hypothetical protein GIB67_008957 [Kingdonia uniflora]|uniref:ARID domain-containing protein n=1 Tax=Kingdonia uniflora TaxID=39325 RepID=A0A7J7LVH4_9MAGN|nr:hypothetical protein GIB67_008957 [Kingdonia uniflora]